MVPAPLLAVSPVHNALNTRAPLNYSTPFVGSALKQPFFSISNGDITCSPANVSYGGSSPPFQLSWQAYGPSSLYNGSFYNPPLEGLLGVYPEAGTAGWNVTASLPEGSWVRLRVQDGEGSISFDSVREVKNGTNGVDGCSSSPGAGGSGYSWSDCLWFAWLGLVLITALMVMSKAFRQACVNKFGPQRRRIIADPVAEPVVTRQAPRAPPVVRTNERAPTQETVRAGGAVAATGGAVGVDEENPPSYEAQLSGKVAGVCS